MRRAEHDGSSLYINLVYAVIIVVFGGGLTWSFAAPLEGAVQANGILVVDKYQRVVQHFEGGIVKNIQVSEGQIVEEGDVLIILDDAVLKSTHDELLYKYYVALLSDKAFKSLLAKDPNIKAVNINHSFPLKDKVEEFFILLRKKVESDLLMHQQSISENVLMLKQAKLNLKIGLANLELQESEALFLDGKLKKYKETDREQYFSNLEIQEMELQLQRLKNQTNISQISISDIELEIEKLEIKANAIEQSFQQQNLNELSKIDESIVELEKLLAENNDRLTRAVIKAPVAGIVINLNVNTEGSIIAAGDNILNIVPRGESLVVEAYLPPDKIDKISGKSKAWVRFSAFNRRVTPVADAVISRVSADTVEDTENQSSNYIVHLNITDNLSDILDGRELVPGMPVEVYIATEKRNAISHILKPLSDGLARSFNE